MSNRRMFKQIQQGLLQRRSTYFYQGSAFGLSADLAEDLVQIDDSEDPPFLGEDNKEKPALEILEASR